MSTVTALEARAITSGYGDLIAIREVSLSVSAGEVLAVLGRNGAGKSTTLASIAGLIPVRDGTVLLDGVDITRRQAFERVARGLAFVQQGKRIFHQLTVEENLRIGGFGMPRRARAEAIEKAYARFAILGDKRSSLSATLSGGQQQMLAIAQALIPSPRVLMLDEPSGGLAPIVVEELLTVVSNLKQEGMTILLVEQLVDKALSVADRVAVLDHGHVVMTAHVDDVDREALRQIYLGRVMETEEVRVGPKK